MLNNIYSPLSGAVAQERVFEILANNLANVNTTAFKEEHVGFQLVTPEPEKAYLTPLPPANYKISLDDIVPLRGNEVQYVGVSGIFRNDAQGSAHVTHNPLDVMLEGDGYMSVQTKDGVRYIRNGHLSISAEGLLTDAEGNPVQGSKGSIPLTAHPIEINRQGEIFQNKQLVDRIQLSRFDDPRQLEKLGQNYFFFGGPEAEKHAAGSTQVIQGSLEASNVNAIRNLTSLVLAHRSYEAYLKTVKTYDTMMEKSNNTLANMQG